jgi:hypothetical protein
MKIKNFKNPLKMYKQWSFKRKLQKIKRSVFKRGETFYIRFTRSRLLGLRRSDLLEKFKRSNLLGLVIKKVRPPVLVVIKKPILIGLILILVIFSAYFLFFYTSQVLAEWWNTNWHYRKAITITNAGTLQTDFQVLVTADTSDTTKFQADCDDLRFTSTTGQNLDYWIGTGCGTAATKIWVKVASIPTDTSTIYMYYGNANASVKSNSSFAPASCSDIDASLGSGTYWIDTDGTGSRTAFEVYCDMTTKDGGWMLVASWATAQEWTKTSTSSAALFGATAMNAVSSNFGEVYINDFRVLASDAVTTVGASAYADWYYHYNTAPRWKEVWATSSNLGGSCSNAYISTSPRQSLKPFNYSYNIKFSYQVTQTYNNLSDWRTAYCGCLPNYWTALTSPGNSFGVYSLAYYYGSNGTNCSSPVADGSLGICPSGSPSCITGQDMVTNNSKVGYDDGGANAAFGATATTNVGSDPGVQTTTKLWWFVRGSTTPGIYNIFAGTPAAEEKSPGPVAYWSFDEGYGTTAQDRTTNNNDGTIGGGAAWQTEDMCVSGKCLWFDGSNDYVNVSNFNYPATWGDPFSISTWIFVPSSAIWSNGYYGTILTRGSYGGSHGLTRSTIDNRVGMWVRSDSNNTAVSGYITRDKWYYLTGIWDGEKVKLYINGIFKGESNLVPTGVPELTDWYIARANSYSGSAGNWFNGFIDEVKIYPYARTATQIKADYNAGRGRTSSEKGSAVSLGGPTSTGSSIADLSSGLIGYWKMDESSGSAADSSGNGNTGTWNGTGSHYAAGKFGNGGGFNGTDDYIEKNSPSIFPSTAITTAFWIKTADSGDGIISYASTGGDNDWLIFNSGNIAIYRAASYVTTNIAINDNNWHHIVVTWRSSDGETKLYKDGAQVYSYTLASGTAITSGGCLDIAAEQDAVCGSREASQYHNGKIDEVRVYNRALSSAEVRALYEWAPGPIGWWKMDEGSNSYAYDISGNGNTGTLVNSPSWESGKYGGSLHFNGTGNYVNAGNSQTLNPYYAETITAWVKLDVPIGSQTSSYPQIIGKRDVDTQRAYFLAFEKGTNVLYWELKDSGGTYYVLKSTKNNWNTNEWYHIAATFDGSVTSNNTKVYVNGVLENQTTWALTYVPQTSATARIGGGNYYLDGSLDDVKLYNYARTQKQVLEDMSAGRPAQKSPVGYWKFDEGANGTCLGECSDDSTKSCRVDDDCEGSATCEGEGKDACDFSGYGNNGTITGATWTNAGKLGKALSFDGTGYVSINNGILNVDQGAITMWYYNTDVQTDQDVLFGPKCSSCNYPLHLAEISSSNGFRVWNESSWIMDVSNLTLGWHHVVLIWNEIENKMKFYVDGVLVDSYDNYDNSWVSTGGVYIGADSVGARSATGVIDEVKIYNYALTQDEIKADYNAGKTAVMGTTKNTASTWDDGGFGGAAPVAEWNFEEHSGSTAYDSSGNGNNGTITGANYDVGKVGSGLNFNGSSNYVTIGDKVEPTSAITVEAWFNTTNKNATSRIISKTEAGAYQLSLNENSACGSNTLCFVMYVSGVGYKAAAYPVSNLNNNQWYHVVGNFNGSVGKLYLNGKEVGSFTQSGTIAQTDTPLCIGSESTSTCAGGSYFPGKIDQVRIFNYARTPAQIAWDYNKGAPIVHYKMDKGEGTTIYDSSGNGNNGTLTLGSLGQTTAGSVKINADTPWYNGRLGKQNYSLNFDGDDDYVSMGSLLLNKNNSTISLWFIVDSGHSWADEYLSLLGGVNWGYSLLGFYNNDLRMESDTNSDFWMQYNSNTEVGKWYHLIVSANGTVKSYLNGKEIDSRGPTNDVNLSNIARSNTTSGHYFPGQIDDVRIYNYALTADQVKTIYNMGAAHLGTGD